MSVIMTFRVQGDPKALERLAAENPEVLRSISERAKEYGLIAHRFYGSDDGQIMVADEWPDPDSFQRFFSDLRSEIEPRMAEIGATGEPDVMFWRKLETGDEVGWES
jgi:hypothetical protein